MVQPYFTNSNLPSSSGASSSFARTAGPAAAEAATAPGMATALRNPGAGLAVRPEQAQAPAGAAAEWPAYGAHSPSYGPAAAIAAAPAPEAAPTTAPTQSSGATSSVGSSIYCSFTTYAKSNVRCGHGAKYNCYERMQRCIHGTVHQRSATLV
jgi:hypothetical protein